MKGEERRAVKLERETRALGPYETEGGRKKAGTIEVVG